MKRAARKIVALLLLLAVLPGLIAPSSGFAEAQRAALLWVNGLRSRLDLSELAADPLLELTAAAYASELAAKGVLAHVDGQGRRALQRYRALGGTTVLVGEILGSGPDLASVSAAWEESPEHSELVGNPLWTHCGAAVQPAGGMWVWVILFTSHRIASLRIFASAQGYLVHGRIGDAERAQGPLLFSGLEILDPLLWDPGSREFSYLIPLGRGGIYHRLGYRSTDGGGVVTNTFFPQEAVTSDPGKGPQ